MNVRQTTDIDEIKSILCHDDIFNDISEGLDVKPEDYEPPLADTIYIGGYEKDKIFALACFHPFRDGLKYHPNVLKSHRQSHGRRFVSYTVTMLKCCIYIEIPETRKDLFNLATKLGFDSVANNKDSTDTVTMRLKDGFY